MSAKSAKTGIVCRENADIILKSKSCGFRTMLARYNEHMKSCTHCSPEAARKILFDACISHKVRSALGMPSSIGGADIIHLNGPI